MANSPVDSVALKVADLTGLIVGTTIYKDYAPDASDGTLDTIVTVYGAAGGAPTLVTGDDTDNPGFEIACRSLDPDTAIANDLAIFNGLHGITETDVHGTHFKLLWALQSGQVPLGRDEKQRYIYTRSYRAYVTGVTR